METDEATLWRRRDARAVEALLTQYDYIVTVSLMRLGLAEDHQYEDLQQCGRIALADAIRIYNPALGDALEKIAIPKVRGAALEWKRGKDSWVRRSGVTKNKQLTQARALLARIGVEEPDEAQLRAALEEVTGRPVKSVALYLEAEELPTLCSLSGGNTEEGEEDPLDRLPEALDTAAVVQARAGEGVIEAEVRALRPALLKAAFRGIAERSMTPREVAEALCRAEAERAALRERRRVFPRAELERLPGPVAVDPADVHQRTKMVVRSYQKAQTLLKRRINPVSDRLSAGFVPTEINRVVKAKYRLDEETWETLTRLSRKLKVTKAEALRRVAGA